MTGAQIKDTLEQSWMGCFGRTQATVILQVSAEIHYSYHDTNPCDSRITAITVNGTPIDPSATYKVAMNTAYLGAHSPVAPGPQDRITKVP